MYMGHGISKPPFVDGDESTDSMSVVFATIGNTTWRMFAPVILGALAGYWIDAQYSTEHSATTGSVIGLVLAGILVWRQYKNATASITGGTEK